MKIPVFLFILICIEFSSPNTKFDFYSMVYTGKDPLRDVIPLPYSKQVIDSYQSFISKLEGLLRDIVFTKIECIERKVDGIVPSVAYYLKPNVLLKEEVERLPAIRHKFNKEHPIHMKNNNNNLFELKMADLTPEQLQWYVELDRANAQREERQSSDHV
jgi:hypothetical protein